MHSTATEVPCPRPVATHTFNRSAEATIKKASDISSQRAGEYYDSWSLDNLMTPWLDNLQKAYPMAPKGHERAYKRLVIMASMIDIKLSRLGGPWKEDTAVDSINYIAAYAELRREFDTAIIETLRNGIPGMQNQSNDYIQGRLATETQKAFGAGNLRT